MFYAFITVGKFGAANAVWVRSVSTKEVSVTYPNQEICNHPADITKIDTSREAEAEAQYQRVEQRGA